MSVSTQEARELRPHLRKKKRTPSLPKPSWLTPDEHETATGHRDRTADLGKPNIQRRRQSNGFTEENLSPGGPAVPRAIERAPFTLPEQRLKVIAEEIERATRLKRAPDPMSKLTPVDRMLAEHEWEAIAWWVATHYRRTVGRPAQMRYDDTPRGMIEADEQKEARWRIALADIREVDKTLHLAGLEVLELIAWQIFPDMREGTPPSEADVGRAIVRLQGEQQAIGGYKGYLRCLAQFISEKKKDAETHRRRLRERKEFAQIEHRKQKAEALFR